MNKKLAGELREQLNKKNRLDSDVQGGEMRSPFPTVTEIWVNVHSEYERQQLKNS